MTLNKDDLEQMRAENKFNAKWLKDNYSSKKIYVSRVETDRAVFIKHTGEYTVADLIRELESDVANFTTSSDANESGKEEINKWIDYEAFSVSYIEFTFID